jgi:hypothetical protein
MMEYNIPITYAVPTVPRKETAFVLLNFKIRKDIRKTKIISIIVRTIEC